MKSNKAIFGIVASIVSCSALVPLIGPKAEKKHSIDANAPNPETPRGDATPGTPNNDSTTTGDQFLDVGVSTLDELVAIIGEQNFIPDQGVDEAEITRRVGDPSFPSMEFQEVFGDDGSLHSAFMNVIFPSPTTCDRHQAQRWATGLHGAKSSTRPQGSLPEMTEAVMASPSYATVSFKFAGKSYFGNLVAGERHIGISPTGILITASKVNQDGVGSTQNCATFHSNIDNTTKSACSSGFLGMRIDTTMKGIIASTNFSVNVVESTQTGWKSNVSAYKGQNVRYIKSQEFSVTQDGSTTGGSASLSSKSEGVRTDSGELIESSLFPQYNHPMETNRFSLVRNGQALGGYTCNRP